jgi:hypothetical protein
MYVAQVSEQGCHSIVFGDSLVPARPLWLEAHPQRTARNIQEETATIAATLQRQVGNIALAAPQDTDPSSQIKKSGAEALK